MDRCVQRLRKRMLKESWEKRQEEHTQRSTLNERVPSFFNSPSLLNLGGLNVSDQQTIETLRPSRSNPKNHHEERSTTPEIVNHIDIGTGWGGMGLRGNRSSGNLHRTLSDGSGLFYEETEDNALKQQNSGDDDDASTHYEEAVALGISKPKGKERMRSGSEGNFSKSTGEYIKTSTMASFYYRQNPSVDGLLGQTSSHPHMGDATSRAKSAGETTAAHHKRQRSKSHADLVTNHN